MTEIAGAGAYAEWSRQVSHSLAQLEARTARLDAHSGELAKELLDVVARVDALAAALAGVLSRVERERSLSFATEDELDGVLAEQRTLSARLADLERSDLEDRLSDRIERITERLERSLHALERRLDTLDGALGTHLSAPRGGGGGW